MNRLPVMLSALAVVLAACGGTSTETSQDAAATTEAAAGSSTTAAAEEESTDSDGFDLGEDGELSLDDFIPGARAWNEETDFRSQEMEIQQSISECMAAEGFEYLPFVPADVPGGFGFDEFDHEEWVKTQGFGISTWILEEDFMYEEADDAWADDPNMEIVEAMDEFELEEYYRVLHGGEPDIIANTPPEELEAMSEEELMEFYDEAYLNWMPDGCWNEAAEEIYGGGEADMAFWDEFGEDFEDVYSRAESDPRIVEAQIGWSACMAEKGHDYANQEEMWGYFHGYEQGGEWVEGEFQKRVDAVVTWPEPVFGELDEGVIIEGEGSVGVATTMVVVGEGGGDEFEYFGPEYDIEELQPLIDEELAVAWADYECSQDMEEVWEEVYKELEQQFIDENLDRLMAFQEQNG
ncbi:MAG: hypothetical protein GY722_19115 [bacterium]|nr:hypothetical protein [bacterium]